MHPELDRWFAEEVAPHEAALRNWLRVRFPAIADRDDLVQEVYLRVWRAHRSAPIARIKPFLFATARNLALDTLKHRLPAAGLGETDASSVLDENTNPAESVARGQEFEILHQALQSLPERCRQVFTLRRLHGLSQKEIAARLGISEKTVEAQNTIAMHKCVQFFDEFRARPARGPGAPAPAILPSAGSLPQHA